MRVGVLVFEGSLITDISIDNLGMSLFALAMSMSQAILG